MPKCWKKPRMIGRIGRGDQKDSMVALVWGANKNHNHDHDPNLSRMLWGFIRPSLYSTQSWFYDDKMWETRSNEFLNIRFGTPLVGFPRQQISVNILMRTGPAYQWTEQSVWNRVFLFLELPCPCVLCDKIISSFGYNTVMIPGWMNCGKYYIRQFLKIAQSQLSSGTKIFWTLFHSMSGIWEEGGRGEAKHPENSKLNPFQEVFGSNHYSKKMDGMTEDKNKVKL